MENNPYAAPRAALDVAPADRASLDDRKASRGERFGGAFIDGLLSTACALPITLAARTGGGRTQIVVGVILIIILTAINITLLYKSGQTIGKKVVNTRIVRSDGSRATLPRVLFLRQLPVILVSLIPIVGGIAALVDALVIFASERRCVHDYIADTIVISV